MGSCVRDSGQGRDRSGLQVRRKIAQIKGRLVVKRDEVLRESFPQRFFFHLRGRLQRVVQPAAEGRYRKSTRRVLILYRPLHGVPRYGICRTISSIVSSVRRTPVVSGARPTHALHFFLSRENIRVCYHQRSVVQLPPVSYPK